MKRFAIFRVEKIKSVGSAAGWAGHALRARPTPNADPKREAENRILVLAGKRFAGSELRNGGIANVTDAMQARLDQASHKMARSVQALDVFMGVSPEWAKQATPQQWAAWRKGCMAWLRQEFGAENVIAAVEHNDETTTHITALVTPIRPDGRLSAAHWVGGEERRGQRLRELQDRFAEALEPAGLTRGVRGSKARHQRVQRFYGASQTPPPPLPAVEAPSRMAMLAPGGPEAYAEAQTAKIQKSARRLADKAASAEIERSRADGAEATSRALERERDQLRQQTAELRALPIDQVLARWELVHDKAGSTGAREQQWRDANGLHRITFGAAAEGVWFDHVAKKGGRGAIDLVAHLEGCGAKEAIAALASRFGQDVAVRATVADMLTKARKMAQEAAQAPPLPFQPPKADPASWTRVQRWLVEERRLPVQLVDQAHATGDLYADGRGNLVALQRNTAGAVTGAEVKGTTGQPFAGLAKGSRGGEGMWTLRVSDSAVTNFGTSESPKTPLIVTESAIDALSVAAIRGPKKPGVYASTAGNASARPDHPVIAQAVERGQELVGAYDSDRVGRGYLASLVEHWGERVRQLLPQLKDWNDQLRDKIKRGWNSAWERQVAEDEGANRPDAEESTRAAPKR